MCRSRHHHPGNPLKTSPRSAATTTPIRNHRRFLITETTDSRLSADERGFLALGQDLLEKGYLYFDYFFETTHDPTHAALHLCREQSTALWNRTGVDEDYRPRHAAKLIELREEGDSDTPFLPGPKGRYHRAHARIAHPAVNFGARLPNLLTAAGGEGAYFTPGITAIRLMDMRFPSEFLAKFRGPQFGVAGLRDLLGVPERPLIWGVVKPNLGLDPIAFADIAYQALLGGADVVKDDEMLADTEYSPTKTRAQAVFERLRKAVAETAEKKLYLVNITDEVERLRDLHDLTYELGKEHAAVMLNALPVGLSACRMLCGHSRVPVVSHFDLIAAFTRVPYYGVSSVLMTRLQRLAGFDAIIMPGLGERMGISTQEVIDNVHACLEPLGELKPSLPLPGGSDWAGSLPHMLETLGTKDFGIIPGRGIFGHPQGPAAGARSIRDAWEAIERGQDPRHYSPALESAYQAFG